MKNTLIKVLSFMMALTMIVGVFSAVTVSAGAKCDHTKGKQVGEPVPATCATMGYTLYECAKCGEKYPDDVVAKSKEHTGNLVDVAATDATCLYPARVADKVCDVCGLNEEFKAREFVKDSKPLGHTFRIKETNAECATVKEYTCITCGKTAQACYAAESKDDELKALRAKNPTWVIANDDDTDVKYTVADGIEVYNTKYPVVSTVANHTWKYVVKTAPTTCEDGVTVATCLKCGKVEDVVVKADHKFSDSVKFVGGCEPYVDTRKCVLCGAPEDSTKVNEDLTNTYLDHTFAEAELESDIAAGITNKPVRAMNAALQKLGYTAATLVVLPTCTTDGYYVSKCTVCENYVQIPLLATNHTWETDEDGKIVVKEEKSENTAACIRGVTYYFECAVCEEKQIINTKTDKAHTFATKVVDPECDAEGYTVNTCIACGTEVKYDYTEALGHEWGDVYYSDGKGDHTVGYSVLKKCATCEEEKVVEVVEASEHNFDNVVVTKTAATCLEKAYYVKVCAVDGCTATQIVDTYGVESAEKIYVGDLSKTNHHTSEENLVDLGEKQAASCIKAGWIKKWCMNCKVEVTVTVPMTEHVYGNMYDGNNNGKLTDAGDKDWRAIAATCLTTGKTAGLCCKGCGATKQSPKVTPIDPTNHAKGGKVTVVSGAAEKLPNCQNLGYTKTYYSCCSKYVTVFNTEGTLDPNNHLDETTVDYVAATCTTAGNHKYIVCNDCGDLRIAEDCPCGKEHVASTNHVIPAKGHSGVIVDINDATNCAKTGKHVVYQKYSICGCAVGAKQLVSYMEVLVDKAATCTEKGTVSTGTTKICTECEKNNEAFFTPAKGHNYTMVSVNKNFADCTAPTYNVYRCNCGDVYATGYKAAKNEAHKYSDIWHTYTNKNGVVQIDGANATEYLVIKDGVLVNTLKAADQEDGKFTACEVALYSFRQCVGCEMYEVKDVKAPISHYSTQQAGMKIEISEKCVDYETSKGLTCDLCGLTVMEYKHDYVTEVKEATCVSDGWKMTVCVDCGNVDSKAEYEYVVATGHNPYDVYGYDEDGYVVDELDGKNDFYTGHEFGTVMNHSIYNVNDTVEYVVEATDRTTSTDGSITYKCNVCNEIVTVVIPAITGVELTVSTEDLIVNNTTVKVNVAVSANDFEFNSLTFGLAYDVYSLEFKSAELVYEGFDAADAVTVVSKNNTIDPGVIDTTGVALINVYVPNGVDGLPKNVVVNGDEVAFVELTFDVLPTASNFRSIPYYKDDVDVPVIFAGDVMDVKVVDDKGEVVEADVEESDLDIDYESFEINYLGDVNADGKIDAGDSVAIMTLIYKNEYKVSADLDGNGVVDLADHVALLKYTVSTQMMFDYLEMIGITIESIVADYDNNYDFDNDNDIDDFDKAILVKAVKDECKDVLVPYFAMGYYLAEMDCATLEDLVDMIAYNTVTADIKKK